MGKKWEHVEDYMSWRLADCRKNSLNTTMYWSLRYDGHSPKKCASIMNKMGHFDMKGYLEHSMEYDYIDVPYKFRDFLIMSGATTSSPMSNVPGFTMFLEREQDYAHELNEAYVSAISNAHSKYPDDGFEMNVPIELMNDKTRMVFFLLGRNIREIVDDALETVGGRY